MSSVVVFGANGFIGKNLINQLAKNETDNIIAFDRFSATKQSEETYFDKFHNVTVRRGDFLNREDVADAVNGADYVFHLVSTTTPASTLIDPYIYIDTNVRASIQLFESAAATSVKKIVFLSSGGTVYGDIDSDRISEDSVTKPKSPYGIGKLTIENYLRYFKTTHGLDYIVYRIANPYGPFQNLYAQQGVIPIFIQHILKSEPITIYGDGTMLRDYIYVEDVATMISDSYSKKNLYSEYNIGSGEGKSVLDIVEQLKSLTGAVPEFITKETPPTFVQTSVLNNKRFIDEFGPFKITSLDSGLERTLSYVKQSISQ